jgi:hypothetical protein
MFEDWAFAQRGFGILVIQAENRVTLVEFNEFLRRIASGDVQADDHVLSTILTEGKKCRAGTLRLYEMVSSGQVQTDKLPLRSPNGILAEGEQARALLRAHEGTRDRDAETLLRPASVSTHLQDQLLHPPQPVLSLTPPEQLPRPASPPILNDE